jgi:hypothetical protein
VAAVLVALATAGGARLSALVLWTVVLAVLAALVVLETFDSRELRQRAARAAEHV